RQTRWRPAPRGLGPQDIAALPVGLEEVLGVPAYRQAAQQSPPRSRRRRRTTKSSVDCSEYLLLRRPPRERRTGPPPTGPRGRRAERPAAVDHAPRGGLVGLPGDRRRLVDARLGPVAHPVREDLLELRPLLARERNRVIVGRAQRFQLALLLIGVDALAGHHARGGKPRLQHGRLADLAGAGHHDLLDVGDVRALVVHAGRTVVGHLLLEADTAAVGLDRGQ